MGVDVGATGLLVGRRVGYLDGIEVRAGAIVLNPSQDSQQFVLICLSIQYLSVRLISTEGDSCFNSQSHPLVPLMLSRGNTNV